ALSVPYAWVMHGIEQVRQACLTRQRSRGSQPTKLSVQNDSESAPGPQTAWPADPDAFRDAWRRRDETPAYRRARATFLGNALDRLRATPWPADEVVDQLDQEGDRLLDGLKQWLGNAVEISDARFDERGYLEFYACQFLRPLTFDEWMLLLE